MGRVYLNEEDRIREIQAYIGELGESLEKRRYEHCNLLYEDLQYLWKEYIKLFIKKRREEKK